MNFIKMTIEQLQEFLDENKVDYSDAKVKADYVLLAENVVTQQSDEDINEEVEQQDESQDSEQSNSLADKVKSAIKIERTETKKVDDTSYLKDRDYSQLSVGERALIRERSPEYTSKETGVKVKVTDRLATKWRIVKLVDKSYSKLIKGAEYTLSQEDYEALKAEKVKVKTEATKNKCCGQARYEEITLLEVI
ncbi:hypothetical protein ACFC3Z_07930 [Enterococcus thailandicus]|uniref:hypothetical protein n=1 Tax=Enterococcus thailandicus TaxID=417368 RepID=UPI0035D9320F